MDLLETRELVYFVAVAEELHFGRAAARVGIAQPALSRAVARLERRMGCPLLRRTSRRVELTAAGRVLLHEGRCALDAVAAAQRRTRRTGAALVLALKSAAGVGLLEQVLNRCAAVPVETVHAVGERAAMVRDGRADLALLHRPNNDLAGLGTLDLLTESQIAVLGPGHPLATGSGVRMAQLAGSPIVRWPESVATAPAGPMIRDIGQLAYQAAQGAVALLPESALGQVPRSLCCLPVVDAPLTTAVLAWAPGNESPMLTAFLGHAAQAVTAMSQR